MVCGPSGTGKSHFIEALGHLAIDKGRTVAWHTLETLAVLVRRHRADDSINKAIAKLIRADLILVDDVGLLPVSTDAAEALFRVIDAAYEKRSIAISSNIHPSGFDELMPKTIATATVDRLMHNLLCTSSLDYVLLAGALERKAAEIALKNAFKEVRELKDRIQAENVSLQEEIQLIQGHKEIIGRSDGIRKVLRQIRQVAQTDSTVLITGETGTGKEMVAWAIHKTSPRKGRAMVCVNCAGLPPSLIESELFGHEKGAFTGAVAKQSGRFEFANSSTIFLDEIGDLPMEVQAKMLRVLQDRRIERLGSLKSIEVDVRIVAATNRDLVKGVKEGRFREDLFYRLNVFPIHVPPLRERRDDIPLLVAAFVQEFSKRLGRNIDSVSRKDMEALQRYSWPGNMRELRNVIERAVILNQGSVLRIHVPEQPSDTVHPPDTLDDLERNHIIKILDKTGWRVSGDRGAARILNINPKTLESRMKKLGIKRPVLHS